MNIPETLAGFRERFNDPEFHTNTHPQYDFAAEADSATPPTRFYKLRVIANHQFRP